MWSLTGEKHVADHCFSRRNRAIFYDPSNLSILCQSCHFLKTHRIKGADLGVYRLVEAREGKGEFKRLYDIAKLHRPFPDFSKRYYLEGIEKFIMDLEAK